MAAIMMLFIAPLISKAMMHHADCTHPDASTSMTHSMMHHSHHDMPVPTTCPSMSVHPMMLMTPGQVMSPMEEMACGYCQLLIHLPFILFTLAFLLWLLLHFVIRLVPVALFFTPLFRPWNPQLARAPPSVFQY
ncbi:DUF2946 domain-containing protein [Citrobacter sp. JGM124]|nr:DUF2946 domain-containing protein [Citrobacter sp. JGM124]